MCVILNASTEVYIPSVLSISFTTYVIEIDRNSFIRTLSQVDDLDAFVKEKAGAEQEGTPFFIGGQSMGGLIAAHEVQQNMACLCWHVFACRTCV
jgi:surfactin synthase thioesterase subunit